MATIAINLGSAYADVTLSARLLDESANTITTVTTGFSHVGNGSYLWTNTIPAHCQSVAIEHDGSLLVLVSVDPDAYEAPAIEPPAAGGITMAEVLSMINSPMGETIGFIPAGGTRRNIRALVSRGGASQIGDGITVAQGTVFIARDVTLGSLLLVKGADRFVIRSQPHLPEREYVCGDIASGDNWLNVVVV